MDDLAALCSAVTLLAAGRVIFSGPLSELVAETDELDYRLRTSDPVAARRVAAESGLQVLTDDDLLPRRDGEALLVRADMQALDDLVVSLVEGGVAVRELVPVEPPLEAAFMALTKAAAGESEDMD
jgi:ABC-2 type transport system ATP-binding protein